MLILEPTNFHTMKKDIIEIIIGIAICIFLLWTFPAFSETVIAEWDANTESDLAGYNIYYGTESGNYDQSINVGNNISWFVDNLIVSAIYYFAITAYDFVGNESNFSDEASFLIMTEVDENSKIELVFSAYPNQFSDKIQFVGY